MHYSLHTKTYKLLGIVKPAGIGFLALNQLWIVNGLNSRGQCKLTNFLILCCVPQKSKVRNTLHAHIKITTATTHDTLVSHKLSEMKMNS